MNIQTAPQFGLSKDKTRALLDTLNLQKKPLTFCKGLYSQTDTLNYLGYNELTRLETAVKNTGATHYKFVKNGGEKFYGDPVVRLYTKA